MPKNLSSSNNLQNNESVAPVNRGPNVVLVITDDQGYGDLGCHGNPIIKTPNIDNLYNESVRLTNFHVGPTCIRINLRKPLDGKGERRKGKGQ